MPSYENLAQGPASFENQGFMPSAAIHAKAINATMMSLMDDPDSFVKTIKVPKISNLSFEVDGIPMNATNCSKTNKEDLILWATLGYLPYSIISRDRRQALIQILEASHVLPTVKIGVTKDMRIVVTGVYKVSIPPTPNYIFEPVIHFIQEARPFIKLIADYL